jgi:hypothetical protein
MLTKASLPSKDDYLRLFQQGGQLPHFSVLQRGKGIGNIFRSLFQLVRPLLITQAQKIGNRASEFGQDILAGQNIKKSALNRFKMLKKDFGSQSGSGRKRKRTKQDIFNVSSRKVKTSKL